MVTTAPSSSRAPRSGTGRVSSAQQKQVEARRFRRALTLVGLSVVAPGKCTGDGREPRLGMIVLRVWLGLVVVCALVLWLVPFDQLARLAVRPWLLNTFTLLAFGVALAWAAVIVDAWRLGYPPGFEPAASAGTGGDHRALGGPGHDTARRVRPIRRAPHGTRSSRCSPRDSAAASGGRLNVLLLGVDAGPGRDGARPDSITVVSVDVRSGRLPLISLPRNLQKADSLTGRRRRPGFRPASPARAIDPSGSSTPHGPTGRRTRISSPVRPAE